MIYVKVKSKSLNTTTKKGSAVMGMILSFLKLILPKANPEFDDKINAVAYWLMEFEGKDTTPDREIGLGINENVIMKMPHKDNYGYWIDNNLTLRDFQSTFEVVEISKSYFDEMWEVEPAK